MITREEFAIKLRKEYNKSPADLDLNIAYNRKRWKSLAEYCESDAAPTSTGQYDVDSGIALEFITDNVRRYSQLPQIPRFRERLRAAAQFVGWTVLDSSLQPPAPLESASRSVTPVRSRKANDDFVTQSEALKVFVDSLVHANQLNFAAKHQLSQINFVAKQTAAELKQLYKSRDNNFSVSAHTVDAALLSSLAADRERILERIAYLQQQQQQNQRTLAGPVGTVDDSDMGSDYPSRTSTPVRSTIPSYTNTIRRWNIHGWRVCSFEPLLQQYDVWQGTRFTSQKIVHTILRTRKQKVPECRPVHN